MPETLVVDCSVAAKWILPEPGQAKALELLDGWSAGTVDLIAPDTLLLEFASLLSRRHRNRQLSEAQASDAFQWMVRISPRLFEARPRLPAALRLSLRLRLSLWDCLYLALAEEQQCTFLTADQRLFRGSAGGHVAVRAFQ